MGFKMVTGLRKTISWFLHAEANILKRNWKTTLGDMLKTAFQKLHYVAAKNQNIFPNVWHKKL